MEFVMRYFNRRKNKLESEFKSPKIMYESACEVLNEYFSVSGTGRMRQDYTLLNARLVFLVVDLCLYIVVNIWCLTVLWGQFVDVIFCLVTMGVAFQGFAKIYSFTNYRLYDLHSYNMDRFENVRQSKEVRESLMKTSAVCRIIIVPIGHFYKAIAAIIPTFTLISSVLNRRLDLPFGFFLPWMDHKTMPGYLVNLLFHMIQTYEACFGLLAADAGFLFLTMHGVGQLDTIIVYLRKLDELALKYESAKDDAELYQLLHEITEKHIEHVKYLRKMYHLMKTGFLINFGCMILETVASLYVLATTSGIWYPGIVIILASVMQIFLSCALGTVLISKNDDLIAEIYNTSWYALPVPAQKTLAIILNASQHPVVLSDGFDSIDLFNFVTIYKKIYSYFTMLQSF